MSDRIRPMRFEKNKVANSTYELHLELSAVMVKMDWDTVDKLVAAWLRVFTCQKISIGLTISVLRKNLGCVVINLSSKTIELAA